VARRLAAGAALCAWLAGAAAGAGEERRASLALRGCEVALEARGNEPVLMLRPGRCTPDLAETREALRALLSQLYPDGRVDGVSALCLGRIAELPWLSERLAAAALASPAWDASRGRPLSGSPERFVAELLREQRLAMELGEVIAGFGARAEVGSVEKVLTRTQGDARVPYDAIVWLRFRDAPPTPGR
jgi:hypothetical protein